MISLNPLLCINIFIIISIILTAISYYNEIKWNINEKKADFFIISSRFLHYMIALIIMLYGLIFNNEYDVYYIIFIFILFIKWLLLNDCIINYIDNIYYNNENLKKTYYTYFLFGKMKFYAFIIFIILALLSYLIVIFRLNISKRGKFRLLYILSLILKRIYRLNSI